MFNYYKYIETLLPKKRGTKLRELLTLLQTAIVTTCRNIYVATGIQPLL
jgi:hypothetical protein